VAAVKIAYHPRAAFRGFHETGKRFSCLVCHRRAGKTVAATNRLIRTALTTNRKDPRVAYIGPTFSQAKDIVWQYARQYTQEIPGTRPFEYDLRIELLNGARLKLYGAENVNRLRGLYFDDVVFDEYALMNPSIWEDVVRPALADRGGRATFMGTPAGMDAFYELWLYAQENPDEWYCLDEWPRRVMPASETGIIPPEELAANFKILDSAKYAREYECDFTASFEGAYYAKQVQDAVAQGRVTKIAYDPALDVYSCWDLGIDDATAIWTFQIVNREWRWLEYTEGNNKDLGHWISWIKQRPYPVDLNFLPHDAKVREHSNLKSRQSFIEDRGLKTTVVKKHLVQDGVQAVRMILPRSWFNDKGTLRGLAAVRMYRANFNEKTEALALRPLHDKNSHAADAMRTGVMGVDEEFMTKYSASDWKKPIQRPSEGSYV
jgi:phage terminase large subunit